MPKEEAVLIQFLEVVSGFESKGLNSLTDFLVAADDQEGGTATAVGDANWNMAVPKNTEAVNIMTIHKSKGLGFPVVITLLYDLHNKGLGYIIEEKGGRVHLLKIKKNEAECDETLRGLYEAEKMREMVNQLNTLYVGFTRPERELYVVGVTNKPNQYPFNLVPVEHYPPTTKPEYHPHRGDPCGRPDPSPLLYRCRPLAFHLGTAEFIPMEERRRGDFIHRVMFFVEEVGDDFEDRLLKIIRRVKEETLLDFSEVEIFDRIISIVNNNEVSGYFKTAQNREIKREQEYVDVSGNLFRMDRVVIDPFKVTVIDYKTGANQGEKYHAQLENYMGILGDIYRDRSVAGLIAYIDLNEVQTVR
jgi:ATP-dependent exoDNAse (exonuclease V) beta subunit